MGKKRKFSLTLTDNAEERLTKLSSSLGLGSFSETMRHALALMEVYVEARDTGGSLQIIHANGDRERIRLVGE